MAADAASAGPVNGGAVTRLWRCLLFGMAAVLVGCTGELASVDTRAADPGNPFPLSPGMPPGFNFDLSQWKITFPSGSEKLESWLAGGGEDPESFFTDPESGGMVFRVKNRAGGSTPGSMYPRSELREMLRAGDRSVRATGINANNWVFSTSTLHNQVLAGGVDGRLQASLRVDHVSETGDTGQVGRVVVGQVHASESEPCRLYYRKLPGNVRGSVYLAYEPNQGEERYVELIGRRTDSAPEPELGIELGERWAYTIEVEGSILTVTVQPDGRPAVTATVNMQTGGFEDDWMYFKAGAYNLNRGGDELDYAQVTFFYLVQEHN